MLDQAVSKEAASGRVNFCRLNKRKVERVAEVAEKHDLPRAHIALAWLLQKRPVVAPIIGATKIPHLESAVETLPVRLTPDEVAYLEEPYVPHPLVGLIQYEVS